MRRNPLRLLAFTSAMAVGIATSGIAFAQTETVNATFTTSSAITSTDDGDMDFGTWFIFLTAAEIAADGILLTLTDDQTATATASDIENSSQAVQITAPAEEGQVNIQTPAPSTVVMTRGALTDFTDGGLALTSTTFNTASTASAAIAANGTANITVLAGLTNERIDFGGVITITANPSDAAHTANFDVTFAY